MKISAWLVWHVLAISTTAFVIPSASHAPHDVVAVAGPIASTHVNDLANATKSRLELEYESLEVLKHRLHELHHEVLRKERDILHIINQDFESCYGVKCYLQTALRKAPDFFELFKTHFRHNAKNATGSDCFWSTNSSSISTEVESPESLNAPFDFNERPPSHSPFDFGAPPPPPPPFDLDVVHDSKLPVDLGGPPPPPPPPYAPSFDFTDDKSDHRGPPPHHASPEHHEPEDVEVAYHGHKPHHERPPFHMPHPAPRPRHFKLILATAGLLTSLLILAVLFKGLRIYCANPRVRAERAARREECRTKREYRRAACQHRLRQIFSRFHRRSRSLSTDDYEEKRAMLRARNTVAVTAPTADVDNHIMGLNIASLRRAHEIVGQLMLAEEGRSHALRIAATQPHQQQYSNPHFEEQAIPSSSRSVHSIHTTTTLPAYAPPPPRYSQELAREIHDVVDGFRYTPTQSGVTPSESSSPSTFILDDEIDNDNDAVTESSVADCISRISIATETEADAEVVRSSIRRKSSFELASDRYIGKFD